jgi:hypothetical protein
MADNVSFDLPINDNSELRIKDSALRRRVEASLGVHLPDDYIKFIAQYNGSGGFVGKSYIQFFLFEELYQMNHAYGIDKYLPELVVFASNGAAEMFAFDKRVNPMRIVQVAGGDIRDAILCGYSFAEFLEYLKNGEFGKLVSESD